MPRKISEATTRKEMIDPQLEKAGWYLRYHKTPDNCLNWNKNNADQIRFLRAVQSVFFAEASSRNR